MPRPTLSSFHGPGPPGSLSLKWRTSGRDCVERLALGPLPRKQRRKKVAIPSKLEPLAPCESLANLTEWPALLAACFFAGLDPASLPPPISPSMSADNNRIRFLAFPAQLFRAVPRRVIKQRTTWAPVPCNQAAGRWQIAWVCLGLRGQPGCPCRA